METWRQVVAGLENGRITVFCSREQTDTAFAGLIEELLLPVADANHARLLSEKTPLDALYFAELLAVLPGCWAIHVAGDPRAVVASLLQVGSRGFVSWTESAGSFLGLEKPQFGEAVDT